MFTDNVNSTLT